MRAEIIKFPVDPIWELQLAAASDIASAKFLREALEALGKPGAGTEVIAVIKEWNRIKAADPLYWHKSFPTYKDVRTNLTSLARNAEAASGDRVGLVEQNGELDSGETA